MRKKWKTVFFVLAMILIENTVVYAKEDIKEDYLMNYDKKVFNSENGLEGTAANCVLAANDGLLWIGGYAGLFTYDGTEFVSYPIDDRIIAINSMIQDRNGNIWLGTNGEGVYIYDGENFFQYSVGHDFVSDCVVNELLESNNGDIYIGTKEGVYITNIDDNKKLKKEEKIGNQAIQDMEIMEDGRIVVITKNGEIYLINDDIVEKYEIPGEYDGKIRCCGSAEDEFAYLGTSGTEIIKISFEENEVKVLNGDGLTSYNSIYKFQSGEYWVCSDTGIGIMRDDKLFRMDFAIDNSVEAVCKDYQGNFWFVSSRQGMFQLSESYFSNLGEYLNLNQTVNSIQHYQDMIYIGCDEGLYCFEGEVSIKNELVQLCNNQRIRQLYVDQDDNLWVATYQNGLYKQEASGNLIHYKVGNSGLTTNQIRCVVQRENKEILIGTEDGVFLITNGGDIEKFIEDATLAHQRIMDIKEGENGKFYIATDGYGIFVIENKRIENKYTKKEGLLSDVVMRIIPSKKFHGVWAVTGSGICFIDEKEYISGIAGIPIANSLDMIISENDKVFVLAGNGLFKTTEEELLKQQDNDYECYTKRNGLPIDFTANSWNTIYNNELYMCGTEGAASIKVDGENTFQEIKLYVKSIKADGEDIKVTDEAVMLPATAQRLNIDIRVLQYSSQDVWVSYCLEGYDKNEILAKNHEFSFVDYTNLKGGDYTFRVKVYDKSMEKCLQEYSLSITKKFSFWENPRVRVLLVVLLITLSGMFVLLMMEISKKGIKEKYKKKYIEEKNKEIERMAYKDLVTGVYNRNLFEIEKSKIDKKRLCAVATVSLNHTYYLEKKYGTLKMESILIELAKALEECIPKETKIYRISENVFGFWILETVEIETFVYKIKEIFSGQDNSEKSVAVGVVYYDELNREDIDGLLERCEEMRLIDEKQAEARFMEGKVKWL